MAVDFGKLYLQIEQPITVTLLSRNPGDTDQFTPHTINFVLRKAEQESDVDRGDAILDESLTIFHLWVEPLEAALTGLRPFEEDRIQTADGNVYTIEEVEVHNRRKRYRCHARLNVK